MAVTVKATIGSGQRQQTTNESIDAEHDLVTTLAGSSVTQLTNNQDVAQNLGEDKAAPNFDTVPKLSVIGVGGAGGNAVNNMIEYKLQGIQFVVANTDAQALQHNQAQHKIQLGQVTTQGLGAGSRPDVGRSAAEESIDEIMKIVGDSNMLFITAGMGGGTGTGAAPIIAKAAREKGILTIGVVTKPFQFEGAQRMRTAQEGIEELQAFVDTLIIIPNQNLFRIANEQTTFVEAFKMADDVLYSGVRSVTDLMIIPGLINLDFADIKTVMTEMGKAMMGTGEARGENRAIMAAEAAIANPLLDDVSMRGAKGVLISVTGGMDMTLFDVDAAANRIREEVELDNANIIFGSTFDESMEGTVRVSVVATGIDQEKYEAYQSASVLRAVPQSDNVSVETANLPDEPEAALDFSDFSNEEETLLEEESVNTRDLPANSDTDAFTLTEKDDENASDVDYESTFIKSRTQKRSFLSRLFGKRDYSYENSSELTVRTDDGVDMESEESISDVPAYMRRQKK